MTLLPKPGVPFLTDAGLETCLVFKEGFELPAFAAFVLLDDPRGLDSLKAYYRGFLDLAERHGTGLVLDMPSWRANPDWGAAIGFDRDALAAANRAALAMIAGLRDQSAMADRVALNAVIGPRGDGYRPDAMMTEQQARDYHAWQIGCAAEAGADIVTGLTMNYVDEAQGIAAAAGVAGLPCVISFTVETDGRLPDGTTLAEAVRRVDDRHGSRVPYYMINCAHPSHFAGVLGDSELAERIGGIRANASRMSHAELDEAEMLDEGDPDQLAQDYRDLLGDLPNLCVLGGCCGTDHRHVDAIARECLPLMRG
ncbi:MAG TPA: homocysteine S-methyltransferase family protein [Novosphingobium sp.]|nr:homocysteine S-methyltransferase family protein [Novosphingobium sp.]